MASKKIQKIVDKFVSDIMEAAEDSALDKIQETLGEAMAGRMVTRKKSAKKGKSILRPCPIKGCKGTAAPRYGMVCKKHSELERGEILLARDIAEKPGGIWYEIKHGKKKSA